MKEDKRIVASKHILKSCLVELLQEMPLEEISVKFLCEKAEINRSTFYRHYPTVNALYEELCDSFYLDLIRNLNQLHECTAYTLTDIFKKALEYAEQNVATCLIILDRFFYPGFERSFNEKYKSELNIPGLPKLSTPKQFYMHSFICGGIINAAWAWLQTKDRSSADEMAKMLADFSMQILSELMPSEE